MSVSELKPISAQDRKLWEQHNIADLLESAELSFTQKIQTLEGMIEVARSIHHGELPPSPDEHEELQW